MPLDIYSTIAGARSFLFVPADRPDRHEKARAAGADLVIVDLEDAVAPENKAAARKHAANWLASRPRAIVRINAIGTPWFDEDYAMCLAEASGILLPKAEPHPQLAAIARAIPTMALIESATGAQGVCEIAQTGRLARLALGAIDLALDLDTAGPDSLFDPLRLQMTIASRCAGLPGPVESVTADYRQPAAAGDHMRHARSSGFTGKLCIHPAQIDPIHSALAPAPEEIERARGVIAAAAGSEGATGYEGQMIDKPVLERARRIAAQL